jgi:hypothetical protein
MASARRLGAGPAGRLPGLPGHRCLRRRPAPARPGPPAGAARAGAGAEAAARPGGRGAGGGPGRRRGPGGLLARRGRATRRPRRGRRGQRGRREAGPNGGACGRGPDRLAGAASDGAGGVFPYSAGRGGPATCHGPRAGRPGEQPGATSHGRAPRRHGGRTAGPARPGPQARHEPCSAVGRRRATPPRGGPGPQRPADSGPSEAVPAAGSAASRRRRRPSPAARRACWRLQRGCLAPRRCRSRNRASESPPCSPRTPW